MSGEQVLEIENLRKDFGGLTAIDGLSMNIARESITGLIGPNGAGKTTLFNLITGVLEPSGGEIYLDGESITGLAPYKIASRGIGRTYQTPRIFSGMSVIDNLAFAARNQKGESVVQILNPWGRYRETEEDVQERAVEVLEFLELDHLADDYARGLSGGQRKLLELGRVLMTDPDVILLDEPIAGINPVLQTQILEHIHELNDQGRTILIIEHDMQVIMNHCEQVVVLVDGQKLSEGPPELIQEDENVIKAYLGGELL